jgi:hypothetical protein
MRRHPSVAPAACAVVICRCEGVIHNSFKLLYKQRRQQVLQQQQHCVIAFDWASAAVALQQWH